MSSPRKILFGFAAFIAAWSVLILLLAAQLSYGGEAWTSSLISSTRQCAPWVLASPLIIFLATRFPITHHRWWVNSGVHIIACAILLLGVERIHEAMINQWPEAETIYSQAPPSDEYNAAQLPPHPHPASAFHGPPDAPPHLPPPPPPPTQRVEIIRLVSKTAPLGVPLYASIVLLTSLIRYRQELNQRDQAALRLETQLTQTQLDLLRSQLQPHFLFNTLNSISSLIHSAPDKADQMVIQLSDLLRSTLDQRDATFIPLEKELTTIQTYLNIQSTRFGDRILVQSTIDPETLNLPVPPMILLPLVENAVRYGVEKSSATTTIHIKSEHSATQHLLSITDDGPGLNPSNESGTGVGLTNTTSRLQSLYPKDTTAVTLSENDEGHMVASIHFPLQTKSTSP